VADFNLFIDVAPLWLIRNVNAFSLLVPACMQLETESASEIRSTSKGVPNVISKLLMRFKPPDGGFPYIPCPKITGIGIYH
jgi:hypothetical protein